MSPITPLLLAAVLVSGRNLENKLSYAPGEKMTFVISAEGLEGDGFRFVGDRCGDDGKRVRIDEPIADGKPVTFATSMDCPGFACLYNALKGPKRISWYQGSTHSYVPRDKDAQIYELKTSEGAMK